MEKKIIGFLAVAAAGALLGILYAPDKGSVTRRRFSRKNHTFSDELELKFDDLIDSITGQFETVVEEVKQMTDNEKFKSEYLTAK